MIDSEGGLSALGKNDPERKLKRESLVANDEGIKDMRYHQSKFLAEVADIEIKLKHSEDQFAAVRTAARLQAAFMNYIGD